MRSSSGRISNIVDQTFSKPGPPLAQRFGDKHDVKFKVKDYVSSQPEQAALAAMAAGAVLTGLLRYLMTRKKSRRRDRLTR